MGKFWNKWKDNEMPLQIINPSLQTYQIHSCLMSVVIGPINFKLCKTLT